MERAYVAPFPTSTTLLMERRRVLSKLSGADWVAIVLIVCCCTLIGTGHNSVVEYVLASVATAYGFGKVIREKRKKK
ncbi:hypothetical protein ES703_112685 [subsurface metagenome]